MSTTEQRPQDHEVARAQTVIRLVGLTDQAAQVEADLREAVTHARQLSLSWSQIARALGVSQQAAHQRFARHVDVQDDAPPA